MVALTQINDTVMQLIISFIYGAMCAGGYNNHTCYAFRYDALRAPVRACSMQAETVAIISRVTCLGLTFRAHQRGSDITATHCQKIQPHDECTHHAVYAPCRRRRPSVQLPGISVPAPVLPDSAPLHRPRPHVRRALFHHRYFISHIGSA